MSLIDKKRSNKSSKLGPFQEDIRETVSGRSALHRWGKYPGVSKVKSL